MGFTHMQYSLLTDMTLDSIIQPCSQFMHDWMHGLFSNGVFNICLQQLMEEVGLHTLLGGATGIYQYLYDYTKPWEFPAKRKCTEKETILTRLEIACNLLREMNLLQELDVHPNQVLCHPCNRSGLGLNPHNAHRTGAKVQSIGADRKQLDTYLFTMPPAGAVAAKHIKFNEDLVRIADGMLAPVNGHELYTSVAGGHFEAFCKAAIAGCKTNQKNIMDDQGKIDVGKLKKDFVFKRLLEKGLKCTIINYYAD